MALNAKTDLEQDLLDESDCPCDCLPFEENYVVTSHLWRIRLSYIARSYDWNIWLVRLSRNNVLSSQKTAAYSYCSSAKEGFVPANSVEISSEGVILGIFGLAPIPKLMDTRVWVNSNSHSASAGWTPCNTGIWVGESPLWIGGSTTCAFYYYMAVMQSSTVMDHFSFINFVDLYLFF